MKEIKLSQLRLMNLRELRTPNGVAFTCTLDLGGKPIIKVVNSGRGGCNKYTHIGLANKEFIKVLKNLENQAARRCGSTIEALDHIISLREEGQYL